jgi:hypothetical protein
MSSVTWPILLLLYLVEYLSDVKHSYQAILTGHSISTKEIQGRLGKDMMD